MYHRQQSIFLKADVPCINEVCEARVNSVCPIRVGDFRFVYLDKSVIVGQGKSPLLVLFILLLICLSVILLYARTGGKMPNIWLSQIQLTYLQCQILASRYLSTCMAANFEPYPNPLQSFSPYCYS